MVIIVTDVMRTKQQNLSTDFNRLMSIIHFVNEHTRNMFFMLSAVKNLHVTVGPMFSNFFDIFNLNIGLASLPLALHQQKFTITFGIARKVE